MSHAPVLQQRLLDTGDRLIEIARADRADKDARTILIAGRDTKIAADMVALGIYDVEAGYAWLQAARQFLKDQEKVA